MTRLRTLGPVVVVACVAVTAPAWAQVRRTVQQPIAQIASAIQSDLHGVVLDDRVHEEGRLPVAQAVEEDRDVQHERMANG